MGSMNIFCYFDDTCLVGISVSLGNVVTFSLYKDGF